MKWTIEKYGEVWCARNGYGVTVWAQTREQLLAWLDGRDTQPKNEGE